MASASSLAHFNSSDQGEKGFETIEIDPQYAQGLGLAKGDLVCAFLGLQLSNDHCFFSVSVWKYFRIKRLKSGYCMIYLSRNS